MNQAASIQTNIRNNITGIDNNVIFAFWVLACTCLMNLNGITAMAFGAHRLMSMVMLLSALFLIYRTSELWSQALGSAGTWFVGFMFTYLALGFAIEQDYQQLISHVNSVVIIFAGASTAYYFAQRNATYSLLTMLTVISVLGASTVYLSPLLEEIYAKTEQLDRLVRQGRWLGFFANPNNAGMASVLAFSCVAMLWVCPRNSTRIRKYLPFIVASLLTTALLSFSRGALVTFSVVTFFSILFAGTDSRAIGTMIIGTLVLLVSYMFFTGGYEYFEWSIHQKERIESVERLFTLGELSDKDTGGRLEGIEAGLDYWSTSPIIGHGLGSFHEMPEKYFGGLGCHNTHVMVLGEVGIIGFTVYLVALIAYLVSTFRIENLPVRMFCCLFFCTAMGIGMVDHGLLDSRNFNMLWGIAFGLQSYFLNYERR